MSSMPDSFFKTLTAEEAKEYHTWAREHHTPEHVAKGGIYHPEVRAEWARMVAEPCDCLRLICADCHPE